MPFNFPSSPTTNQTYSLNGVTYIYNATIGAWTTTSALNSFADVFAVANSSFAVSNGAFGFANGVSTNTTSAFAKANSALQNATSVLAGSLTTTGSISDSIGNVRRVPVDNKTAGYTLAATDVGKTISITTGGVTIPANIFSAGDIITLFNNSGSPQSIVTTGTTSYFAGTSATGDRTMSQRAVVNILCIASNQFVISGPGLT